MTESELENVEASVSVVIPPAIKDLLLFNLDKYPEFEFTRYTGEKLAETYLQFSVNGFEGRDWHAHLLPIGEDTDGSFTYFVDLQDSKPWLYSASPSEDPHYHPDTYKSDCRFGLIL